MKLFNAISAAAVFGTVFFGSTPVYSQTAMSECLRTSANNGLSYEKRKKYCECALTAVASGDSISTAARFCALALPNL